MGRQANGMTQLVHLSKGGYYTAGPPISRRVKHSRTLGYRSRYYASWAGKPESRRVCRYEIIDFAARLA